MVFQFNDKKQAEGKSYEVYMMTSANKSLRIYYIRVNKYFDTLDAV